MPEEVRADLLLGRDTLSPGLVKAGKAASDASGNVRQLTRDLYEAGKVRATPVVDLQDATATAKLKDVSQKLRDLGTKVADPQIDVKDKAAVASVAAMRVKLDQLGRQVSSPRVTLEGLARAEAGILTLDLALDKLSAKTATPDVSGSGRGGILGRLGGLFGGGGGGGSSSSGGAGGSAAGGSSLLSGGLTSPAGIGAIGAGVATLGPSLVGLGIGGAVGLGGIGLVALIAKQAAATIKLDQAQVKAAKSGPALAAANRQLAADMKANSPFIAITADIKGLLTPLQQILTPFAKALDPIIRGFGGGLSKLGPQISAMFKASLPFVQMFAGIMLQMGKTLIPAFTTAMNEMVKSGALKLMTQGLVILIQGLAQFIVALGPGMKSSAILFKGLATIISGTLHVLGIAFSVIANAVEDWFHRSKLNLVQMAAQWDNFRHRTAVVFDGVRHDIAHTWDLIWSNTFGRLQRGIADDQRLVANFRHAVAGTFDGLRHDIAAAWNTIWSNTVTRVRSGISTVVGWFAGLPRRAVGALTGLGHSLAAFASAAINQMWTGFKGTFSAVIHWFTGLPKMILHALGIKSPPGWAISAGKHIMAGLHIGLGHGLGQLTNFTSRIGAQVAAGLSGALGGGMGDSGARTHSAAVAQAYARSLLSMYGWSASQMSSLIPLWNQESGWSAYAVNQSSGAYGIPQSLGHGHPYALGDYKNQIIWGLNYIRGRYGSPAAAEAHERAFNWYGGGLDAIFSKPTVIGVGERGPEHVQVTPRGHPTPVVLQVRAPHGATNLERALVEIIQKFVTVNGGDVQSALGRT